jgi:iron(III) transport system substrate-binding protein
MKMIKKPMVIGSMLLLSMGLASCSSGGDVVTDTSTEAATGEVAEVSVDPNAEIFMYNGDDREAFLMACAAEEGNEVQWYTSLAGKIHDGIIEGFQAKYPDMEVVTFRGDETDISSRIVQETLAKKPNADVMELSSDAYRQIVAFGVMGEFTSPFSANYSDRFTIRSEAGEIQGLADRTSYVGFAYNTDKLAAADVPATIDDLLNPALKDKLAITDSTTGVRFLGNVLTNMGEAAGGEFIAKLGEQNVRVESVSGSALAGLIASGEVTASPGIFRNHVQQIEGESPIKWVPLEPVTANVGYSGVFKDAPHPCSAMLFLDFVLGDDGGAIYAAAKYPRPDEDLGFASWVPDESYSVEDYEDASVLWLETFDSTFR